MSAKKEAREIAYRIWSECGQNLSETVRVLERDHGLPVTRQTLAQWAKQYDWEGRSARAEAASSDVASGIDDEGILGSLLAQKQRYESYFESMPLGAVDNQATYAYAGLLKTIVDLRPKDQVAEVRIDRPALFLEDLRFIFETVKEVEPEGLKVLARCLDEIARRGKEKYAQTA